MNVISKKKLFELLDSLEEGNAELKKIKDDVLPDIWLENIGFFAQLLSFIQGYFLELGEIATVPLACVEAYSETLVLLQQNNSDGQERLKLVKIIKKQLDKLRFEIKRHIPDDKKKLVFFPYNASMWDSFESVWKAAVERDIYDVAVVPIPFYTRNPDGSLGTLHYEGDLYPPDVPVVDWQTYSLEEEAPDVAYIHNPYDGNNYVTSVHPDFYSKNLKKYVGSLVYIPYFVVGGALEFDFCVTPGPLEADKVIVANAEEQESYVTHLLEYSRQTRRKWTRKQLQEKILPLGSPKLDLVASQHEVPPQWETVMKKPNGTRKKVLFFNTSLTTVLKHQGHALKKYQESLAFFEARQEEIALLWRPHPLMEDTLRSMRPQLLTKYLAMVEKYKQDGWGIFDESGDLNRAISVSDGYYGDRSSVIHKFREAKLPVFVQNAKPPNFEEREVNT